MQKCTVIIEGSNWPRSPSTIMVEIKDTLCLEFLLNHNSEDKVIGNASSSDNFSIASAYQDLRINSTQGLMAHCLFGFQACLHFLACHKR